MGVSRKPEAQRFSGYVRVSDSCWEWQGAVRKDGYGIFWRWTQTMEYAHRVAHELATGTCPMPGYVVMHSCDNRRCCNPAHLSIGTQSDNIRDMVAKDRHPKTKGAKK